MFWPAAMRVFGHLNLTRETLVPYFQHSFRSPLFGRLGFAKYKISTNKELQVLPEENTTRPLLILEPAPLSRNGLVVAVPTQNRFALTVVHHDSIKFTDQYVFGRCIDNLKLNTY